VLGRQRPLMTRENPYFAPHPRPEDHEAIVMSYIQKRHGRYRARYRDPLGRVTSTTFDHKADAQRFLAEMETDKHRGSWIDPRHAEVPLAQWSQEFLALARRLSPPRPST